MLIPDSPIPYNPVQSAGADFAQESPSGLDVIGNDVTSGFSRKAGSFLAENAATAYDALSNQPKMPAEAVNAMAPIGNDGKPTHITDEPMYENVADMLIKDKQRELVNENMVSRYSNAHGILPTFAVSAAGFIADPSNLAMTAYGGAVLGASKVLTGLGAVGLDTTSLAARLAARGISGGVGGAVSMAPLSAAQYGISQYQNGDYDLKAALNDMAFGAAFGAVGHAGFGLAAEKGILSPDALMKTENLKTDFQAQAADLARQPAPVKAAAINSTIADVVNDRPVDTQSVIGKDGQPPNLQQMADDRNRQNQNGYSSNMTDEQIDAAKQSIMPDGVKVAPRKTPLPDQVVDRYQPMVDEQLSKIGISDPNISRAITQTLAEIHNPEGVEKPRSLEEVQQGKKNTNPVWKSVDVTPKTAEVAPKPEVFPALPKELKGAKSGYKIATPQFASDVDKALYIVREKSSGKSKSHDKYMDYLKNTAGLSDSEIRKGSEDVLNAVKQNAEGKTGNVDIPQTFKRTFAGRPQTPYAKVPAAPKSLIKWLAEKGGIKDEDGDLKAMDADKAHLDPRTGKAKPFAKKLVTENGMDLDEAARAAHEAGYFPEKGEQRPTVDELKQKIREDLHGNEQFSDKDHEEVNKYNDALKRNAEIDQASHEAGVSTEGKTHAEFWKEVKEKLTPQEAMEKEEKYADEAKERFESWHTEALEPEELEALENERKQANDARDMEPITKDGEQLGSTARGEGQSETVDGSGGRSLEPTRSGESGRSGEAVQQPTYERVSGIEGEQAVMPGMEKSAKQAMQARGDKITPKAEQKPADEGLFKSAIGGGDELDLQIAQAEKQLDMSKMNVDERAELELANQEALRTDANYAEKLKQLGECLNENGV